MGSNVAGIDTVIPTARLERPTATAAAAAVDRIAAPEPTTAARAERVGRLLAGRVPGGIDFDPSGTAAPTAPAGAFQLYTRAADKVEATVAVRVGRALDVRG